MGECILAFSTTLGGGVAPPVSGNIYAKQYPVLPELSEDNVIAVISDIPMKHYVIDMRRPTVYSEGDVWVQVTESDRVLSEYNGAAGVMHVRLGMIKQRHGGGWLTPEAFIGVNGGWVRIANRTKIYGFTQWKNNSDPATSIEYSDDAIGMAPAYMDYERGEFNYGDWKDFIEELATPVMLNYNGTEAYELDRNNQNKKADGSPSDIANTAFSGNAMVRFKTLYIKMYSDAYSNMFKCSFEQVDDTYKAYHAMNAKGVIQPKHYIPMFRGSLVSGNWMRSMAGQTPLVSKTAQEEINAASVNGAGYSTNYWSVWTLRKLLYRLISKNRNTQKIFGQGNTSGNSTALTTGTLRDKGAFFGYETSKEQVKCFYAESCWGDLWERTMGCGTDGASQPNTKLLIKQFPPYNITFSGYDILGTVKGGWQVDGVFSEKGELPISGTEGNSGLYDCDYIQFGVNCYATTGGYYSDGANAGGCFLRVTYPAAVAQANLGASLFYVTP